MWALTRIRNKLIQSVFTSKESISEISTLKKVETRTETAGSVIKVESDKSNKNRAVYTASQKLDSEPKISQESVLSLKGFGIAFNKQIVLSSITLDVPETGVMNLMGPSGTGKSTLLKAITGICLLNPAHRTWGKAHYAGNELFSSDIFPSLVSQNIKLMVSSVLENIVDGLPERSNLTIKQQRELAERLLKGAGLDHLISKLNTSVANLKLADMRHLAILRQVASNPKLLCIDEPTASLDKEDSTRIINYLNRESKKRAILVVTHNKLQAKALGGLTVLIAGGWVQEIQETADFFKSPISDVAKTFVETGSCTVPSPDAKPEEVATEFVATIRTPPKDSSNYKSQILGPNNFLWLKKGLLAGTPRPGLLTDIETDLESLQRVGITDLISLTMKPLDGDKCQKYKINVIHEPIPDMQAPSMKQALRICKQVQALINKKRSVAIHCKAGLGRTGTLLAAQLIFEGESALFALEKVRQIEVRWIQSESQVAFLEEFERFMMNEPTQNDRSNSNNNRDAHIMA